MMEYYTTISVDYKELYTKECIVIKHHQTPAHLRALSRENYDILFHSMHTCDSLKNSADRV